MIRNLLALTGLVLGLAGAVFFAVSGVLIWSVKKDVDQQATNLAGRANEAADAADHAVGFVQGVLKQADTDLANARDKTQKQPVQPTNPFVQMAARQATQQLAGSVNQVHGGGGHCFRRGGGGRGRPESGQRELGAGTIAWRQPGADGRDQGSSGESHQ